MLAEMLCILHHCGFCIRVLAFAFMLGLVNSFWALCIRVVACAIMFPVNVLV